MRFTEKGLSRAASNSNSNKKFRFYPELFAYIEAGARPNGYKSTEEVNSIFIFWSLVRLNFALFPSPSSMVIFSSL